MESLTHWVIRSNRRHSGTDRSLSSLSANDIDHECESEGRMARERVSEWVREEWTVAKSRRELGRREQWRFGIQTQKNAAFISTFLLLSFLILFFFRFSCYKYHIDSFLSPYFTPHVPSFLPFPSIHWLFYQSSRIEPGSFEKNRLNALSPVFSIQSSFLLFNFSFINFFRSRTAIIFSCLPLFFQRNETSKIWGLSLESQDVGKKKRKKIHRESKETSEEKTKQAECNLIFFKWIKSRRKSNLCIEYRSIWECEEFFNYTYIQLF